MATDADNIQVLKCFTLHNTLRGLCIMLSKITGAKFIISTLVVADGQVIDEKIDTFDYGKVME